ncbi:regulator of chromosome condensation 1/beta-lactamase-inhibitor protein II [Baffinella frigidus]|nr:regulator of chromosome condensation 1/beta-lactamase-inhibitor protein II [Cryptophyta sp. CCMP2293]
MGLGLPSVSVGTNKPPPEQVCLGQSHSCLRHEDGKVKCWGDNRYGQLGYGDTLSRGGVTSQGMGDSLPGVGLGFLNAAEICCGEGFTCAILDNGSVKCWGHNDHGQLAQGHVR